MFHRNHQTAIAVAAAPQAATLPHISPQLYRVLHNLGLLTGGSLLWVLALQWFMVPGNLLGGGLLGIAMIGGHFFTWLDVAWLNLLLNLPLFWLGYRHVGKAFMLYSLFGILVFSLLASSITLSAGVDIHPLWASLGAGLLCGGGSALILRSDGTAGGLDILAVYLRNRFRWRIGRLVLSLNTMILLAGGGLMGLETLFYSLLFLTICSYTIDALVRPSVSLPSPHHPLAA